MITITHSTSTSTKPSTLSGMHHLLMLDAPHIQLTQATTRLKRRRMRVRGGWALPAAWQGAACTRQVPGRERGRSGEWEGGDGTGCEMTRGLMSGRASGGLPAVGWVGVGLSGPSPVAGRCVAWRGTIKMTAHKGAAGGRRPGVTAV